MTNLLYKISLSEAGYMLWTGIFFSEKQKFIQSEKSQDDMFFLCLVPV
mgnify:CR=1 FL=1